MDKKKMLEDMAGLMVQSVEASIAVQQAALGFGDGHRAKIRSIVLDEMTRASEKLINSLSEDELAGYHKYLVLATDPSFMAASVKAGPIFGFAIMSIMSRCSQMS